MNGGESGSEKKNKEDFFFNMMCNMKCQYNYEPLFA